VNGIEVTILLTGTMTSEERGHSAVNLEDLAQQHRMKSSSI
jgi:hypothetical protein